MRDFWRRNILARAAAQVVGVGLTIGLGFVILTFYLAERNVQEDVSRRVHELVMTVDRTAQIACFTNDELLAQEVVNGLVRNSEVFGAALWSGELLLAEHKRDYMDAPPRGRVTHPVASPFDETKIVGALIVDPNTDSIRKRVGEHGLFVALLLAMQLLAVVSAVAVVVVLRIVRPIKGVSDKLHVMDARSIEPLAIPVGHENTEIGRLIADINQLGQRLSASLDEEHRLYVQREIGERKYRAIFENADSGIFMVDQHLSLESCNNAFFRQLGLLPQIVMRDDLDIFRLRWRNPDTLADLFKQCAAMNHSVAEDFEYLFAANETRWYSVTLTPVGDRLIQGQILDISRHKQAELSAQHEAISDALTGLLNRAGFLQKVDEEIAACLGRENAGFALLMSNFDAFRRINESLGLSSGDKVLVATAQRLRSCVKSSDFVSRLGNDSFGIVLRAVTDEEAALSVVTRISTALKGFFEVGGTTPLQLGASIGITLFPTDGNDRETLLRNAEMAIEHARLSGSGHYSFFDFTMARNAEHRRRIESDLRFAVRHDELAAQFQPIVDLTMHRMTGVEALLRWLHPQYGLITPEVFIPVAEETGAIVSVGLWMLEAVCQQLARWKEQGIADRYISINVSPRQIPDGLPPLTLIETVNRYGVDPANLAIEITESLFMGNSAAAQMWLDAVHELGFRIYLDDFGTGYSSLSYIKRFPLDVLKIDKSFVRDMADNASDRALVGAIINMARSLELTVVAEGVETQRQLELLKEAGCRCVQGYYFSPPVAADAIEEISQSIEQQLLVLGDLL